MRGRQRSSLRSLHDIYVPITRLSNIGVRTRPGVVTQRESREREDMTDRDVAPTHLNQPRVERPVPMCHRPVQAVSMTQRILADTTPSDKISDVPYDAPPSSAALLSWQPPSASQYWSQMIDSVSPRATRVMCAPRIRHGSRYAAIIRPDKGMTTLSIVATVFIQSLLSMASSRETGSSTRRESRKLRQRRALLKAHGRGRSEVRRASPDRGLRPPSFQNDARNSTCNNYARTSLALIA